MRPTEQDEYALVIRARDGDLEALALLVERLRLWLFAVAYAELGHYQDAQDVVASTLVRASLHIGDLRDPARLRVWMRSIVQNEARRLLRKRVPIQDGLHERREEPPPEEASLLRIDVEQALRRLPRDQSHAIALFYLGGISIQEIARRTGRPEGTVKSWLHYGRRQLAYVLKEYAPMQPPEWTATLVSTDLEPATLQALSDALRSAGYTRINHLSNYLELARLEETDDGDAKTFHLSNALQGTRFLILDERIGGHSAFELYPILRATAEGKAMATCLLLDPAGEQDSRARVLSAWASGFDLCLTKPVESEEFARFAKVIREKSAA